MSNCILVRGVKFKVFFGKVVHVGATEQAKERYVKYEGIAKL